MLMSQSETSSQKMEDSLAAMTEKKKALLSED